MPLINVELIEGVFTLDQDTGTVIDDGPLRARITANSNETVVEDA
jgi:hypothetical protein